MTHTARILLLAAAGACLTSPALAGDSDRPRVAWNPWLEPYVCSAYEYAHKCNAQSGPHSSRCRCLGDDGLGWRLNEYYGPGARNLAPRNGGP
jgi:hypothetical protein